jgi:hypothetical protein
MKQNIIVVDDFYQNPQEVREFALKAKYPEPTDDYTYPGRNSNGSYYSQDIHQSFEKLVKEPLIPADKNGYFRISLETATHKQDIHVDPSWEWGAVIYMSAPEDCIDEGGTSFWKHNTLHSENIPKTDEEAQFYGYPTYKECWWTTIYGDGLDRSKWSRYFLCPMRYNRLVLFRTHLWHSHNFNFGNTIENGRLVQLFFFNPVQEW